ncbi:MAG: sugar transferase [Actinomycetota bacterium]
MAQRLEIHLRDDIGVSPPNALGIQAAGLTVRDGVRSTLATDRTSTFTVSPEGSTSVEPSRILGSAAVALLVIGVGCGLTVDSTSPRLVGAVGLIAITLVLVFLADGFAVDAFLSVGELIRSFAFASATGMGLALGLGWVWSSAVSEEAPLAVLAAFAFVGFVVEGAAVASHRTNGRRPSALLLADGDAGEFDREETPGGDVQIVARLAPPFEPGLLAAALTAHRPSIVLVASPLHALDLHLVRTCSLFGARILVLADPLFGLAVRDPIVRLAGRPWVALRPLAFRGRHRRVKRALDVGLVLLSTPAVLPLMAIVGMATILSSRGGMLYRQIRLGEGGRPFILYKFRSMQADAERETGPVLASPDDPRATLLGRFLRRAHLDELPQLWNVLRGEMSLVGPRPERPELASGFRGIRDYQARTLLKPGLTGLAQLVAGYSATPADKLRCDLLYLTSFSVRLDLRLIAATARDLLRGFPHG